MLGNDRIASVRLTGNGGEVLCGPAEIKAFVDYSVPSITMTGDDTEVTLDCGEGVQLNMDEATSFIISLPPMEFAEGFTVELTDVDGGKMTVTASVANTITRSSLLRMPAITYVSDLSAKGTANSYIVSQKGAYKIRTVKGNSDESVGEAASAEVLWESFGTDVIPNVGDLVKDAEYSDGYISFKTADTFKEGNAVIAAKDEAGNILWSWHLWFVEDEIVEHEYANNAGTLMERNLGATSAVPGEVQALGLLYQWGRKDPFLGSSSISGDYNNESTPAMSTGDWPDGYASDETIGTITFTIANPTTFIKGSEKDQDWYYPDGDEMEDSRWSETKNIYDPCPPGWQVPDVEIWKTSGMTSYMHKFDDSLKGFEISHNGNSIWYPGAGYQEEAGQIFHLARHAEFWGNGFESGRQYGKMVLFHYEEYTADTSAYYCSRAKPVRCYKIGSGTEAE